MLPFIFELLLGTGVILTGVLALRYRKRLNNLLNQISIGNAQTFDCFESLTLQQFLQESFPFPILAIKIDQELHCTFCNEKLSELTGCSKDEITKKKVDDLFHNKDISELFLKCGKEWNASDNRQTIVMPFTDQKGKQHTGEFILEKSVTPQGHHVLFVIMKDLNDVHKMTGILQNAAKQEAFLNVVMSRIPCQVFIKDAQDDFRYCIANKNFTDYYSLHQNDVIGHIDSEFFSPDVAEQLRKNDTQTCSTPGKLFHFDEDVSFQQTRKEIFKSLKTAFRTEDGHLYLLGVCVDITESANYTTRLQNTQELLHLILNSLPVNIFAKDSTDNFRYTIANQTFADFVGYPVSEIIGKTDAEIFKRPEDAAWFREQDLKVMKHKGKIDMPESPVDGHGNHHYLQTSKLPATAPDGTRLLLGISVDVTELHERINVEHVNNEILEKAVAEPDLPKVLANISNILIEKLKCSHVVFAKYNIMEQKLKLFHEECIPGIKSVKETGLENHEQLWMAHLNLLKRNTLVVYNDFKKINNINSLFKDNPDYPTRSLAAAPVFCGDSLSGVLMVSYSDIHTFSGSDRNLLSAMANVIALSEIHNEQELATQMANQEKRAVLDNVSIPLWLYDKDGHILQQNKAACEIFGAHEISDMHTPFSCAKLLNCQKTPDECPVRKSILTGKNCSAKYHRGRNEFEVTTSPVFDDSGNPVGAVSSFYDITNLNLMIDSRSAVKDCLSDLLCEQDMTKAIRLILQRLCERLNANHCYLAKINWSDKTASCVMDYSVHGEYLEKALQKIPLNEKIDFLHGFKKQTYLLFTNLPPETVGDGLNRYPGSIWHEKVHSVYVHRIQSAGELWGYLALTYDSPVDDLTETEKEFLGFAAYCTELMLLYRTHQGKMISAMEKAKNADRAKSMFLSSMSHEIRTPLNAVIGFSELLKDNQLSNEERDDYIDAIRISGNALLSLINDVLDLSKLEANRMVFTAVETDLHQIQLETQRIFQQQCAKKGLSLEIDGPDDFPIVKVDCLRIRQLLFNLVGNAVKFTNSGSIHMQTIFTPDTNQSGTLTMNVIDSGIGISENDLKNLFSPFVQASGIRGTKTANNGTGLGLALCKRLVERMNGKLNVISTVGKGSTFSIVLQHVEYRQNNQIAEASEKTKNNIVQITDIKSLLLVDDVPMNLKIMKAILRKIGIFDVVCASSGKEALAQLNERSFQVVMTDMWMPLMDGMELVLAIHKIPKYADLPVIAVTADVEANGKFPMDHFAGVILKPITSEKCADILRKIQKKAPL